MANMCVCVLHAINGQLKMSNNTIPKDDHFCANFKEKQYNYMAANWHERDSPVVRNTITPMNNPSLCDFNDILSIVRPEDP